MAAAGEAPEFSLKLRREAPAGQPEVQAGFGKCDEFLGVENPSGIRDTR